jgi:hypothetical protein
MGFDVGGRRGPVRKRRHRRAAVDQHPAPNAVDGGVGPEMAVRRHFDPHFPPRHLLRIEPEPLRHPAELRLVRRLLDQDEQGEGEQGERESEAEQPADQRKPEEEHEQKRSAQGVERDLRPVGVGGEGHVRAGCGWGVNRTPGLSIPRLASDCAKRPGLLTAL